jgi:hypothetical protein
MDNDDEMMMEFSMQNKQIKNANDGFNYSPSLPTTAHRSPLAVVVQWLIGADQGSASVCRCTF